MLYIFDLGNVIVDIDFNRALGVWSDLGRVPFALLQKEFQMGEAFEQHERGEISDEAVAAALCDELGMALSFEQFTAGWQAIFVGVRPDALLIMQKLRAQGDRVVILSNTNRLHCEFWPTQYPEVQKAADAFGKIDIVVNNAAFQMTRDSLDEISDEEFDRTMKTNLYGMFWICKAAVPHMPAGGSIINTASVNADPPTPKLIAYSATKAAIVNFSGSLAALLAEKGIRTNAVAPGPIWTPLIPSTMPPEQVKEFGSQVPLARAGQPAELAPVYVMLASDEASYVSGATIAVTGGQAVI